MAGPRELSSRQPCRHRSVVRIGEKVKNFFFFFDVKRHQKTISKRDSPFRETKSKTSLQNRRPDEQKRHGDVAIHEVYDSDDCEVHSDAIVISRASSNVILQRYVFINTGDSSNITIDVISSVSVHNNIYLICDIENVISDANFYYDVIYDASFKLDAFGKRDPHVSRLLMCCNDVESNPGPLTTTANDDNSSTGSNKSTKARQNAKERQSERERSTVSTLERLNKHERSLIR